MINQTAKGIYILIVYHLWMMIFHFILHCCWYWKVSAPFIGHSNCSISVVLANTSEVGIVSADIFVCHIGYLFILSSESPKYYIWICKLHNCRYGLDVKFNNINQKIYVIGSTSSPSDSSSRRLEELLKRLMFPIKLSGVDVSVVPDMLCIGSVAG